MNIKLITHRVKLPNKDTLGPAIVSTIERLSSSLCTVEPPNKGHIGTSHCVHYREVVLVYSGTSDTLGPAILSIVERVSSSVRSKNVLLLLWEMVTLGHYKPIFLEMLSLEGPYVKPVMLYHDTTRERAGKPLNMDTL